MSKGTARVPPADAVEVAVLDGVRDDAGAVAAGLTTGQYESLVNDDATLTELARWP